MGHVNNIVFCTQSDALVLAIGKRTGLRLKRKRSGFRWGRGVLNQRRPERNIRRNRRYYPESNTFNSPPGKNRMPQNLERCSEQAVVSAHNIPQKNYGSCIHYAIKITGLNNYISPAFLLTLQSINDLLIQPLHDRFCFRRYLEIVEAILNHSGTGRGFSDRNFVTAQA